MFLRKAKISVLSLDLCNITLDSSPQAFDRVVELRRRWNGSQGRVGGRSADDVVLQMMTLTAKEMGFVRK